MNPIDATTVANRAQKTAIDPGTSVWVSASAGSGKTKVLVERVLALLLAGTAPHRILCLTFTKAAAAEMGNRISKHLATWVTAEDRDLRDKVKHLVRGEADEAVIARARRLFAEVLDAPGGMQISTLHAFCQSLLRRFPLEAGIAPHFALMDERDTAEALEEALEDAIARAHEGGDDELADALSVLTARVHESNFSELMGALIDGRSKLARMLGEHSGLDGSIAAMRAKLGLLPGDTKESMIDAACANDAFDGPSLRLAVQVLATGTKNDQARGQSIADWLDVSKTRGETFATYASSFITQKGDIRASLITKKLGVANPDIMTVLQAEAERIHSAKACLKAVGVAEGTSALMRIGGDLLERYNTDKARRGLMDYDDLIQTTRQLLERPGVAEWVLYKLDGGIDHILIDEAQDTNPDQWAIVKPLRDEFFTGRGRHEERSLAPRTVFAVGDRKQSIYSFQGAAPGEFDREHADTKSDVLAAQQRWEDVDMNVSFRSAPAVLDAVDAVFDQNTAKDGIVLTPEEKITHLAARRGHAGLVEIWPAVEPDITDAPVSWKPPVERHKGDSPQNRLAALVAARIERMVTAKERLESRDRSIRPGDIMVLVRRRTGFVEELVRQLKQRRIAVAGVDRMILTDQMAVMDLIALGEFLLLPEDDLTLATVLRSPLVGLSEKELFTLAHDRDEKHLWDVLNAHAGSESHLGDAQAMLADLLSLADYLTPAELYGHVLVAGHGRRKLLARLGADADDPIDEFLNLALNFEKAHPPSLQGFLSWLAAGKTQITRDLDQSGTDAVRVMTVHGAKGLEAPIVFLPDTTQVPTMRDQLLWTNGDSRLLLWASKADELDPVTGDLRAAAKIAQEREYHRLMYVAMTRAEDRLYVCGWKTRRPVNFDQSWYSLIRAGVESKPQAQNVVDDFLATKGALTSAEVLRLTSKQTEKAKKEQGPETVRAPMPLPAWGRKDPPPESDPPHPLIPSRAARGDPPVNAPLKDDGRTRYKRGLIIHRLLQSLPDMPAAQRREAAAAFVQRPGWDLDAGAQDGIITETLAVLENPAFVPVFAAGSKAEVPLTGLVGKFAVSGQVDRLAVTDTDVWIIDYKANRPPPRAQNDVDPAYVFQMATYRAALRAIYPNHTIHCVLLWTHGGDAGPFSMELEAARMDEVLRHADLI
jgi:ATP-dependent helicase/nuclease subunit A